MSTLLRRVPADVVVLTHNGLTRLPVLIRLLHATLSPDDRLIVIENGSTDGTADYLRNTPGVDMLETGSNLSPGAAFNLALQDLKGGRTLLRLDDDVIPFPGCISRLLHIASQEGIGVAGGTLYSVNGDLQHCGGLSYHPETGRDWCVSSRLCHGDDSECSWISGACMAISKDGLLCVPRFDDSFPFWFEDIDYCFCTRKKGLSVRICPEAELYHLSDGNIDSRPIVRESHKLFCDKWSLERQLWDEVGNSI